MRALGLSAVQTYVPWNWHETEEGSFNFGGAHDLAAFANMAREEDLLLLLRLGPYICGEWEFGGFPAWLLAVDPPVTLRTFEKQYIARVDSWFAELLPRVKPLLYANGGNVIMVQIENEFGSYGDVSTNPLDKQYLEHLLDLVRVHLGQDIIVYTTDGGNANYMIRGSIQGSAVYTVGDHGPLSDAGNCEAMKQLNAPGLSPSMDSEYYTGWLTHWGENQANTSSAPIVKWLADMLSSGASVNLYMAYGGTNFGYMNGANGDGRTNFQPSITSYDYSSPIAEGGGTGLIQKEWISFMILLQSYTNTLAQSTRQNTPQNLLCHLAGHTQA